MKIAESKMYGKKQPNKTYLIKLKDNEFTYFDIAENEWCEYYDPENFDKKFYIVKFLSKEIVFERFPSFENKKWLQTSANEKRLFASIIDTDTCIEYIITFGADKANKLNPCTEFYLYFEIIQRIE